MVESVTHLVLSHTVNRTTTYSVKNNSDFKVNPIYIEHKAGTRHDGFVINTPTNEKSVTGFSRFALHLDEHTEAELVVEEEANYEEKLPVSTEAITEFGQAASIARLDSFLKDRAKGLEKAKLLSKDQRRFIVLKLLEAEKRKFLLDLKDNPDRDEPYLRKLEKKPGVCSPKSALYKSLESLVSLRVSLETIREKIRLGEELKYRASGGINKKVQSMVKRTQEEASIMSKMESVKFDMQTMATSYLQEQREGKEITKLPF